MRSASSQIKKLGRAADARERVLDLVRQHGRHGGYRARRVAVDKLVVDLARDRALLDRDHDALARLAHGRDRDRDEVRADARALEREAVLGHRVAVAADLLDQAEHRAVRRQELVEPAPDQRRQAGLEERLGGLVGVGDGARLVDHEDRRGQRVQHRGRIARRGRPVEQRGGRALGHHAAARSMSGA
jgi:hypothetical protein